MICKRIRVSDFRNIRAADVSFDDGVNLLVGRNAQGKTNLLEAIFYASLGKSFRASSDEEMIRFGADLFEISLDFADSVREQNLTVRLLKGKRRRIEHNRVRLSKVSEAVGLFRTVLFCPEHLSIVKEGPGERRNLLDVAISQLYPAYLHSLQNYNKVLKQRNQLLRAAADDPKTFRETIEFWSQTLAGEAAVLAGYRKRYCDLLDPKVKEIFHEMTGGCETPTLCYEPSLHAELEIFEDEEAAEKAYFEKLMGNHEREIAAESTLWGTHKDDVRIDLNGKPARTFASQGQQRSLALAIKLAEGSICEEICREMPAYLLDDVFSELDSARRSYLAEKIVGRQVIITTCEENLPAAGKLIRVENGEYFA